MGLGGSLVVKAAAVSASSLPGALHSWLLNTSDYKATLIVCNNSEEIHDV